MSHALSPPTPPQEEDAPRVRKAVVISVVTLLTFAGGIAWVLLILRSEPMTPDSFQPPRPNRLHGSEIGIVDQPLFEGDRRLLQLTQDKRKWLESYGWVDRDAGIIHIPIERAMDRVAAEARQ
jgi:hypothetical protein